MHTKIKPTIGPHARVSLAQHAYCSLYSTRVSNPTPNCSIGKNAPSPSEFIIGDALCTFGSHNALLCCVCAMLLILNFVSLSLFFLTPPVLWHAPIHQCVFQRVLLVTRFTIHKEGTSTNTVANQELRFKAAASRHIPELALRGGDYLLQGRSGHTAPFCVICATVLLLPAAAPCYTAR